MFFTSFLVLEILDYEALLQIPNDYLLKNHKELYGGSTNVRF